MGKTDHGDNCQGENGGVKTAWGKCLWGFTDRIVTLNYCTIFTFLTQGDDMYIR